MNSLTLKVGLVIRCKGYGKTGLEEVDENLLEYIGTSKQLTYISKYTIRVIS